MPCPGVQLDFHTPPLADKALLCGCSVQQQFAEVKEEAARHVARLTESFEADRAKLHERLLESYHANEDLKVPIRSVHRPVSHLNDTECAQSREGGPSEHTTRTRAAGDR